MTDYNTLSDFEINMRVAEAICRSEDDGSEYMGFMLSELMNNVPDYCNNPSDAWAIIINNGISICYILNRKIWQASAGINPWCQNDNPLRAAMIVYLMMNEA